MISRRGFVSLLGGAGLAWPRSLEALNDQLASGGAPDDEAFWAQVRRQFTIPEGRIYLNNGTLGPSPRVVVEAVEEHGRRVAATFPPGVSWDDLKGAVAGSLGGEPNEWVFPRNTTEAMSFVAWGLELASPDEIVTTDHEHIGGLEAWRALAARRGIALRIASLPVPAQSGADLLEAVWSEVNDQTRVVSVSHVTFTNGTVMPIGDLARRCREAGIILVVDGAHPPGMLRLDVGELGGDFYASSPHKWLLAPQGTGLLRVAPPWGDDLWPTLVSGGWDDETLGAHRLNHMGTLDESRMAGLLAALHFHAALGIERTEARVRYLGERLKRNLGQIEGVTIMTPAAEGLWAGMVSFTLDGVAARELQALLARRASVRTRVIGEYGLGWMRLSTHVYNLPNEVDMVAELIDEIARSGAR